VYIHKKQTKIMSNEIAKNYGFDEEVTVVTYPASMELKNKSWFNECCVYSQETDEDHE